MTDRVIALVDMDCFYCQVEERLNPEYKGQPLAVIQYNPWRGGGIIAVNYEARGKGVTRGMRGDQAKGICPEIILASVPMQREKADLSRYRDAGREVVDVFCKFGVIVQRASIDEAFIDLTEEVDKRAKRGVTPDVLPNTFVVGYPDSTNERNESVRTWLDDIYASGFDDSDAQRLAIGAAVIEEMRQAVYQTTGFKCSAGIAHNKILAKLVAGMHKPNAQTVLPQASVPGLYAQLPLRKVRNLGGKFGRELENSLKVNVVSDLLQFSMDELKRRFDEKTGTWLYHIARGFDFEPVTPRITTKSIGCCKNFPGRTSLSNSADVDHWVNKLSEELFERLIEDETLNRRKAQHLVFSVHCEQNKKTTASSKSMSLPSYSIDKFVAAAYSCLRKICTEDKSSMTWSPTITFMGLSASRFTDATNSLTNFFKVAPKPVEAHEVTLNESAGPSFFEKVLSEAVIPPSDEEDNKEDMEPVTVPELPPEVKIEQQLPIVKEEKQPRKTSILSYFKNGASHWVNPEEIFPDVESIDEETLNLFPVVYRKKILEKIKMRNVPKMEPEPNSGSSDLTTCTECGASLPSSGLAEHMDFHVAASLHKQLNQVPPLTSRPSPKKLGKRKPSKSLTKPMKKLKGIDSFFKSTS